MHDASPGRRLRRSTPQQFQRETNIALVLRSLRDDGPASRSELAVRVGIDRSTMTSIAAELLDVGLVYELEAASSGSRGGRRPRTLTLDGTSVVAAGAELGDRAAHWVACSLSGDVLARGSVEREAGLGADEWVARALAGVRSRLERWRVECRPGSVIAGLGVGMPGVVDPTSRMLRESVILGVRELALGDLWEAQPPQSPLRPPPPQLSPSPADVRVPLLVDNDANCCAWNVAEEQPELATMFVQLNLHRNASGGLRSSLAGIGLSLVLNGRVYYGSSHAAGELRGYRWRTGDADQLGLSGTHTTVDSEAALATISAELLQNLGVIATALDPGRIILAGDLSGRDALLHHQLHNELAGCSLAPLHAAGTLEVARPDQYPVSHGAARMVLFELFSLPSVDPAGHPELNWLAIHGRLRRQVYKAALPS